ncbi:MAG: hypothetical protein ACKOA7_07605 [Bacteroidota bacterium]
MKKHTQIVILVLFISSMFLSSCKKDTPDPEPKSEFSVAGQSYTLSKGYLLYWGLNSDSLSVDWDVLLVSDGVYYSADSVGGTGQALYLDLNSSSNTELSPGTYMFANQRAAGTFVDASALISYDFAADNGVEYFLNTDVPGGPIVVKKSGSIYELEVGFNANRDGSTVNQPVTGYFKGQLNVLDFSMMRTTQKRAMRDRLQLIKNKH